MNTDIENVTAQESSRKRKKFHGSGTDSTAEDGDFLAYPCVIRVIRGHVSALRYSAFHTPSSTCRNCGRICFSENGVVSNLQVSPWLRGTGAQGIDVAHDGIDVAVGSASADSGLERGGEARTLNFQLRTSNRGRRTWGCCGTADYAAEEFGNVAGVGANIEHRSAHGQDVVDLARMHQAEHGIAHDHDVDVGSR